MKDKRFSQTAEANANPNMQNRRMAAALAGGECVDLSTCDRTPEGWYVIPADVFQEGVDYCNAETEAWIWSVGQHRETRQIVAAETGVFFRNPTYDCLWLR